MIDLSAVRSLDDLPESVRELFAMDGEKLTLDESKIRTETDITKMKEAKDKEVRDHNAAKAELAKYRAIGKTPDEVSARIADLESRSGDNNAQNARLAEVVGENNKLKAEKASLEAELNSIKPEYETLKADITQRNTSDALAKFVGQLKGVENDRLTHILNKDIQLGLITLDESGQGLVMKNGGKLEDYAMETAKTFGFLVGNNAGGSNPGKDKIPASVEKQTFDFNPGKSIFDAAVIADLDK